MIFSEIFEYLGSGLKVPTEINGFLLSFDASLYQKRKIENLIVCWFYDHFMLFSEICEYLGSVVKVPTAINGFLLSIDASLYQKRRGRTGLVVRASDSGSGDPDSILGRVGVLFP